MAFELPDLPYAYDALEPHIDAETMRIHHDLHHVAYVTNANAALEGTPLADADVVQYLVDTLSGLGLDTRVQNSVGSYSSGPGSAEMASVRNVVAVLPGRDPTGRIILTAHHDSVQTGPGASDDGAGVSALLDPAMLVEVEADAVRGAGA